MSGCGRGDPTPSSERQATYDRESVLQGGLEMRKLKIDHGARFLLRQAFKQDVNYELHPQSFYLDLSTGRATFVYESDEDAGYDMGIAPEKNQEERLLVESDPDRFLLIPGLSHADHHVILLDFLSSPDGR